MLPWTLYKNALCMQCRAFLCTYTKPVRMPVPRPTNSKRMGLAQTATYPMPIERVSELDANMLLRIDAYPSR
jgi:hypothetical protein